MCAKSERAVCGCAPCICLRCSPLYRYRVSAVRRGCGVRPNCDCPGTLCDQISGLVGNDGSSGLAAPQLPGPKQTKAGTMPSYDRFWVDDGQRRAPVAPEAGQTDPQQAVPGGQFRAFSGGSLKHADLVAQSQVLEPEGSTRTEDRRQSCEECRERN